MKNVFLCAIVWLFMLTSCSDEFTNQEFETILFEGNGLIQSNAEKSSARKIPLYNKPLEIKGIESSDEILKEELNTLENTLNFNISSLDVSQSRIFTY